MPQIAPGTSETFRLVAEQVLTATGAGRVDWLTHSADIPVGGSLNVGPFRHPLTVIIRAGDAPLDWSVPDPLTRQIAAGADRIRSARIIQHHLIQGKIAMALHDKMKALADKMHATPRAMSDMADRLDARMDAVAKRGAAAEAGMHAVLDDVEKGVSATEDALNQLTNGAPVGESSPAS